MKAVLQRYKTLFDELNVLEKGLMEKSVSKALSDFIDFLIDAYIEGFAGAGYILGEEISLNVGTLSGVLNKEYNGESIFDKFVKYHGDGDELSLARLMESEVHRIYNAGGYDCAVKSGEQLSKTWLTVGDERVRDTHAYLEGMTIPLKEVFTTNDGDFALAPGGFVRADNNVNCRCVLQFSKI